MSDVTHNLAAAEQLLPLVYDERRKLADARLAAEPARPRPRRDGLW